MSSGSTVRVSDVIAVINVSVQFGSRGSRREWVGSGRSGACYLGQSPRENLQETQNYTRSFVSHVSPNPPSLARDSIFSQHSLRKQRLRCGHTLE